MTFQRDSKVTDFHSSLVPTRALRLAVLAIGVSLGLGGCATKPYGESEPDPVETFNRFSYAATDAVDKIVLTPASDAYINIVPKPVQTGVSNFFDNLGYLNVVLNDVLQGKLEQGAEDSARFLVNSTVGILGIFDVATDLGLPQNDEDFGQTLGVWGAGEGAYLFVPMKGPSSLRDIADIPVSLLMNPLFYADSSVSVPLGILSVIDQRARADAVLKLRDQNALDPYVFTREAWRQARQSRVYDGNPPDVLSDDLDGALRELDL